jgi:predicted GNAT family N-acyltransferase
MGQNYRFQLLAPPQSSPGSFGRTKANEQLHRHYLTEMQKLRGRVYLKDGAIQACEMEEDGRFVMRGDEQGWHLLLIDDQKNVIGCARYLVHSNTVSYDKLRISHSALAKDPVWGPKVRAAVEADLETARKNGFAYVEIGGWALSEEWRGTRAALEILVGSYALAHLWGGCLGACTATVRHSSSSMLRRIGGSPFKFGGEELPAYEDAQYDCQMELLRFDCRTPGPRFAPLISQLKAKLADAVAITPHAIVDWKRLPEWGRLSLLRMAPLSH